MLRNKRLKHQKNTGLDYRLVRARMIERGTSLHAWSYANGFNHILVMHAIRGAYHGPKASRAVAMLKRDLAI
jgi:hypothetical protein